jgi:hypothetical protein
VSAETLTASDLNSEFNNVLNYLNAGITGLSITGGTLAGTTNVSGGQLAFPATQSASADGNTLDDYEEFTWPPSIGGSATYTTQTGTYTKIGRLVYIRCKLTINAIGTGSTTVISGLPFACNTNSTILGCGYFTGIATSVVCLIPYVASAATTISFAGLTAAATSVTDPITVFQNGAGVIFSGAYETA